MKLAIVIVAMFLEFVVLFAVIHEYAFTLSITHISITYSGALNWCASYSKSQLRCLIGDSLAIVISESNFV